MEEHVAELAEGFWSGTIDADRRKEIEAHLAACRSCREAFDAVGVAVQALTLWDRNPRLAPGLERRLVALTPRVWPRRLQHVAALLIVATLSAAGGYATARRGGPPRSAPSTSAIRAVAVDTTLQTYLLLLEESSWPPAVPLARVGYGDWSRGLAAEGRFVDAEKLSEESGFRVAPDGSVTRPEESPRPPNLSGWYLIRARDYDDAIALARRGPHLRHGSVLVRQIE
jgi:hypothetical protein